MGNILAIDIGGSKLLIGLVTEKGQIVSSSHISLPEGFNYDKRFLNEAIGIEVRKLIKKSGSHEPIAIGVSVPGPCDHRNGIFFSNVNLDIKNWHIKDEFEQYFKLPVFVENDANACAVGEKHFGNCKELSDFLWITLSTGCGGGLFLNNNLYHGTEFLAGEIGHIQVEFDNPRRCKCGIYGDMEAEGSGNAIGEKYLELTGGNPDILFKSKQVGKLAHAGDKIALRLFYQSGVYLARLCAIAANLLNIQKAVIGGGVSVYNYDLLEPGINDTLPDLLFSTKVGKRDFHIEKTDLGYNAALLGAVAITLECGR